MSINNIFLNFLNSNANNTYHSAMTVEKLILLLLEDYISKQNKPFISNYSVVSTSSKSIFEYDGYAPDGFDDYFGETAIEIKIYRSSRFSKNMFYNTVKNIASNGNNIKNLILIVVANDVKITKQMIQEIQTQVGFTVDVWDINDLNRIFKNNEGFLQAIDFNINNLFLKDTISKSVAKDAPTYLDKRKRYADQLNNEYENDNLVLFLGAGASKDARIATWDVLISKLFVALVNKELLEEGIDIKDSDKNKIIKALISQNGNSPLLQTRYLRNGLDKDFQKVMTDILYMKSADTSDLLEEIGQLCISKRGKIGIQAIVSYNFDDLVEINLDRLRVEHVSVYADGIVPNNNEIGIYHVHGFLPRNKDEYENLSKSLLVFSEEGYHKLLLEPYHWANISQLNYLVNNTCLFIGLSMTDPNLRRLLEVAAQKNSEGKVLCKHYAILPRFHIQSETKIQEQQSFEKINDALQESYYKELGVNVLWIDDYTDIPKILKSIKNKMH